MSKKTIHAAAASDIARIMRTRGYIISAADVETYLIDKHAVIAAYKRGVDPYANGANPWAATHKTYAYNHRSFAYCVMQEVANDYYERRAA